MLLPHVIIVLVILPVQLPVFRFKLRDSLVLRLELAYSLPVPSVKFLELTIYALESLVSLLDLLDVASRVTPARLLLVWLLGHAHDALHELLIG